MLNKSEFLDNLLQQNGHHIQTAIQEQMLHYLHCLQRWNHVFNLTGIKDPMAMIRLHILDSLSIRHYLHGEKIIDVGTGAGLPGIPLALTHPEKKFVLLDSQQKKTLFLTQVVLELKLNNVDIIHGRAEDFQSPGGFDSILTRAFASLKVMLQTTEHLVSQHGQFLAMKGNYPDLELQDIPDGFKIVGLHKLLIKGLDAERHLICLEKDPWEKQLPSSTKKVG